MFLKFRKFKRIPNYIRMYSQLNTCGEVIRVIKVNDGRPIYPTGEQIDMYLNPADIMQY